MSAIIAPASPSVNPTPADLALADRFAWLADGGDADAYPGLGWQVDDATFDPSPEDFAADLGFQLGADGVPADEVLVDPTVRSAFEAGHNAGDDHLWRVDPLFASYLKERAEAAFWNSITSDRRPVDSAGRVELPAAA